MIAFNGSKARLVLTNRVMQQAGATRIFRTSSARGLSSAALRRVRRGNIALAGNVPIVLADGCSQMSLSLVPISDRISDAIAAFKDDGNAILVAPRDDPRRHHLSCLTCHDASQMLSEL